MTFWSVLISPESVSGLGGKRERRVWQHCVQVWYVCPVLGCRSCCNVIFSTSKKHFASLPLSLLFVPSFFMCAPCPRGLPVLSRSLAVSVSVYGVSLIHKICLMVSLRDRCLPLQQLQLLPQLICQRLTHVLMDSVYRIWIQAEAQVGVRFPYHQTPTTQIEI